VSDDGSGPLSRSAVKDGEAHPVTIRWSSHPGLRGFLRYDVEINGPFGTARAEADDLFAALQRARRGFEKDGWLLAVEGSRRQTHPSGMQRDQGGGLVAYRLEDDATEPYPVVGILDPVDPVDAIDCVTVVEQERWYDAWLSRGSTRPSPVVAWGRGWAILSPALGNGRRLYRPVVGGAPQITDGVPAAYGDRIDALAAGDDAPESVPIEGLARRFPQGVDVDPGEPWGWRGIPQELRRLPRLALGSEQAGSRAAAVVPAARVFGILSSPARLVLLPNGTDLAAATDMLAADIGGTVIPPLVLVVAGAEPGAVRRALKGLL
jgi:hypothetical protein